MDRPPLQFKTSALVVSFARSASGDEDELEQSNSGLSLVLVYPIVGFTLLLGKEAVLLDLRRGIFVPELCKGRTFDDDEEEEAVEDEL